MQKFGVNGVFRSYLACPPGLWQAELGKEVESGYRHPRFNIREQENTDVAEIGAGCFAKDQG
jgi:hypothetical protein